LAVLGRALLAGPVTVASSVATLCAAGVWMPQGAARVDHVLLPLLLLPALWCCLFLHACLDRSLMRAYGVQVLLLSSQVPLVWPRLF
jgi:hypothetical protein